MRTAAGLSDVSRHVATAPKKGAVTPKKGIFAKISEYARRVAGIVGLVAGAGIAAASNGPAPQYWEKADGVAVTKPTVTDYKVGDTFDPQNHEAMFEAPVPGTKAGQIIQVMTEGFMLHDRLLRPAQVGVSSMPKS